MCKMLERVSMTTYWQKYQCPCKQGHWLIRTDRNLNQLQMHCITCETTIKTEIVSIEYTT